MSYSEYITIYTKSEDINFEKVASVCKGLYEPKLSTGYWDNDTNIFSYIARSLEKDRRDDDVKRDYTFHFCNHDNVNDEEVHKCHKIFCKVCNYLYDCMIELDSQIEEPRLKFIWTQDNELLTEYKDMSDEKHKVSDYLEKLDLENKIKLKKNISANDVKGLIEE